MENEPTFDDIRNPKVTTDPWLNKYSNVVLCPDKVAKGKQAIEKFGLPDLQKIRQKTSHK